MRQTSCLVDDPLERLRRICLALPETTERIGVYLDVERDEALGGDRRLVEDAYRMVAPRALLARLDAERSGS